MQNMKKKGNGTDGGSEVVPKTKERHIVSWSQEEDDILREQIRIHGSDNWAIIASKFKDKTTRQCRRRWFTYLNSDFKKGGWSAEEDMLLCEAQKLFGNRWTEIAKVVSGRTDNAVKNRFTTLCKKRAKQEAMAKENSTSYINLNNKRVLFPEGQNNDRSLETALLPKRRKHIPDTSEDSNMADGQQPRPPFAVLEQNFQPNQHHANNNNNEVPLDASSNGIQGSYLKKDDPKIIALMQQAELLSSLALKVNTENTNQSFDNAWKAVQEFLDNTKENDLPQHKVSDIDCQLEKFKELMEDMRNNNEGFEQSWRQSDLYAESPDSSEYSTGSTILSQTCEENVQAQAGLCEAVLQPNHVGESITLTDGENINLSAGTVAPPLDEFKSDVGDTGDLQFTEFNSPSQVTPLFRSLAAGIPSPQFSESERSFLLKTLGIEPASPIPKPSQPPACKRALLHCL